MQGGCIVYGINKMTEVAVVKLLYDALILFLLIYACLDITRRFAHFLLSRLSHPRGAAVQSYVFSDRNAEALEGLIRTAIAAGGDVVVVDIHTTAEGWELLGRLCEEFPYLHIWTQTEYEQRLRQIRVG